MKRKLECEFPSVDLSLLRDNKDHRFETDAYYLPSELWAKIIQEFLNVSDVVKLLSCSINTQSFFRKYVRTLEPYFLDRLNHHLDLLPTFCHCSQFKNEPLDPHWSPYSSTFTNVTELYQKIHTNDLPKEDRLCLIPQTEWKLEKMPRIPLYALHSAHSTCTRWMCLEHIQQVEHHDTTFLWNRDSSVWKETNYPRSQTAKAISKGILPDFPQNTSPENCNYFSESPVVGCTKCIVTDFFAYQTDECDFKNYLVMAELEEMKYHRHTKEAEKWLSPNVWRKRFGFFFDRKQCIRKPFWIRDKLVKMFSFKPLPPATLARTKKRIKEVVERNKKFGRHPDITEKWIMGKKMEHLEKYESDRKVLIRDFFIHDIYYWLLLYERFSSIVYEVTARTVIQPSILTFYKQSLSSSS